MIHFALGLIIHGKSWAKHQFYIPTRKSTQIRSHAQKFFKKCKLSNIKVRCKVTEEVKPLFRVTRVIKRKNTCKIARKHTDLSEDELQEEESDHRTSETPPEVASESFIDELLSMDMISAAREADSEKVLVPKDSRGPSDISDPATAKTTATTTTQPDQPIEAPRPALQHDLIS